MWCKDDHTTDEQAEINRNAKSNDGARPRVEATAETGDGSSSLAVCGSLRLVHGDPTGHSIDTSDSPDSDSDRGA